ncbi:hypothetical protein LJK87_28865 [Paenibacillus sp. P25]|nr:hypothetical protein LJK87_28865 [Paenibacillus sp. P25]
MIQQFRTVTWLKASLALFLSGSMALGAFAPAAHAGEAGVFVDSAAYFTLDQAALSSSTLQFSLRLHNGSGGSFDFNNYGVRVTDTDGRSFTAKLNEKKSSVVAAGEEQVFRFTSSVAASETANRLKVDIFRWDESQADFMSDLGESPVEPAVAQGQGSGSRLVLNMYQLDNTLAGDASVGIQLGRSYRVFHNNEWEIYSELTVRNLGSASLKLPSALLYRLKDGDGLTYASTLTGGSGQSLFPGQSASLVLKTPVPAGLTENGLTAEFYTSNQGTDTVLGSLNAAGSLTAASLGSEQSYTGDGTDKLSLATEKSVYNQQSDGLHIQTIVTLTNQGDTYAAVPSLSATYEFGGSGAAVTSSDHSSRAAYLAPKESVSYYFNAVLPSGADPNSALLVLWKSVSASDTTASASTSSSSTAASTAATGTAASTTASGTTSGTTTSSTSTGTTGSSTSTSDSSSSASSTNSSASTATGSSSSTSIPVMAFSLKGAAAGVTALQQAQAYEMGSKLALRDTGLIDKNLDVSLVELHLHENEDYGYKTAIAKFKFTNNGTSSVTPPALENELSNSLGQSYTGTRQSSVATQIMPGTSYIVSYSYLLPSSEKEQSFALNVYDDQSVAQGKISLGAFQVAIQPESDTNALSFYPFLVNLKDYSLSWTYSSGYSYLLDITMDIQHQDPVVVDQNFSKMEFDLVDTLDRVVGSKTMTFTGTDKLISGKQRITFTGLTSDQIESGITIRVYETIDTPGGTVKRLVKELK